eukprot:6293893-Amphidinium_carterae.1
MYTGQQQTHTNGYKHLYKGFLTKLVTRCAKNKTPRCVTTNDPQTPCYECTKRFCSWSSGQFPNDGLSIFDIDPPQ